MAFVEVIRLRWNDVSHAAGWIRDIASIAGNDVEMKMEDGLAGRFSDIDADVEAVRLMPGEDFVTGDVDGGQELRTLLFFCVEPGRDVSLWDEKRVSGGDGNSCPRVQSGVCP